MSELTLLVLRFGFLILLWFFVLGVVYALRSDLFGQGRKVDAGKQQSARAASAPPAPKPTPAAAPRAARSGNATVHNVNRIVITSGTKQGTEVPLDKGPITIGRAADSTLVLRDDYTSTHHARLLLWNDDWMLQDLDSTNGTFLAGKRVGAPTAVKLGAPIKVGQTTFELRG
ncbi:FHA domain-containing protein FhaB/FipA [Paramicrobacterium agarici]|uniref:Type III secretion system (T3SS) inner membrane Yop/YscD-like protein n=1 Tax=Paramicrobacterium agarici TaxID=630514 RepID=A0A2A9DST1_9MICO|nr:FHA domain-containing protein [Microbacterium agarici]PFG29644.1 type III secretion system (T3SS) inner membrane Yop/YscD-like protein [Microbacterium agarici]TQO22667.1 type III secretion system (T3SS) inner membrane Yop/YscD-like protein [Microbacterium agarici]